MSRLFGWLAPLHPTPRRLGDAGVRRSVVRYRVSRAVEIDRYWKSLPIGRGPACVARVHGQEVLRFDCFGAGRGHYHAPLGARGPGAERRHYFAEPSAAEQVERSVDELRRLEKHLARHPEERFRRVRLDPERLDAVCRELRRGMLDDLARVPELRGLAAAPDAAGPA